MAKYSSTVEYNIKTSLDKSGLTQLQNEIKQIELSFQRMSDKQLISQTNLNDAKKQLSGLSTALNKSFNSSIGMLDLKQFRQELSLSGVTAKSLGNIFSQSGASGQVAFNNLIKQIGSFDSGIKRTSSAVDKMFNTISNTVRWGIVSSGFSQMLNALHQSVDYVKELDSSLTQIMLVTDYSRQQMNEYAKSANEAAKALGSTTTQVTQGSLVFAQQGYDLQQSSQLAELSIKLANASQQDAATTSDQITAYMNAYGLDKSVGDLTKALDSWALVANVSAADVSELATASQKAASTANTVGVTMDQLNGQIAAIESVTREAPEQIGNGLKTLYARFSDLEMGETLEDGVDLGTITSKLQAIGVEVLDSAGKMRGVGDIMEDLMGVWKELDTTQQASVAQTLAGRYQLGRFEALMNRSDLYEEYTNASMNASGTLDEMNQKYVDSMEGRMNQLQASWEELIGNFFNPDDFYPAIDAMKSFVEAINTFVESVGGGETALLGLSSLMLRVFSTKIAESWTNASLNNQAQRIKAENIRQAPFLLEQLGVAPTANNEDTKYILNFAKSMNSKAMTLSEAQVNQFNDIFANMIDSANEVAMAEEALQQNLQDLNSKYNIALGTRDGAFFSGDELTTQLAHEDLLEREAQKFSPEELGRMTESQKQAVQTSVELNTQLQKTEELLLGISKGTIQSTDDIQLIREQFHDVTLALQELRAVGTITEDQFDSMSNIINELDIRVLDWDGDIENIIPSIREMTSLVGSFVVDMQKLQLQDLKPEELRGALEKLWESHLAVRTARQKNTLNQQMGTAMKKDLDQQQNTKNIVETTAAIGQLAFAWQSFQGLGSLWRNEDLSVGEKILQTIINLSMTLPNVVTAFKQIHEIGGASAIFNGLKENLIHLTDFVEAKFNQLTGTVNSKAGNISTAVQDIWNGPQQEGFYITPKQWVGRKNQDRTKLAYLKQKREGVQQYYDSTKAAYEQDINNPILKNASNRRGRNSKKYRTAQMQANKSKALMEGTEQYLTDLDEQIASIEDSFQGATKSAQTFNTEGLAPLGQSTSKIDQLKNGFKNLGSSIFSLIKANPFEFIALGIGAITTVVEIVNRQLEEYKNTVNQAFEDSNTKFTSSQEEIDNFNTLYDTWKMTGEGADELKASATSLTESLGISGQAANIAAGEFDKLHDSIKNANDEAARDVVRKALSNIEAQSDLGWFRTTDSSGMTAWNSANLALNPNGIGIGGNALSEIGWKANGTPTETLGTLNQGYNLLNEKMEEIQKSNPNYEEDENYIRYKEAATILFKEIESESNTIIADSAEAAFDAAVAESSFQESIANAGGNVDTILSLFRQNAGTAGFLETKTDEEQLDYVINNIQDEDAKNAVSVYQQKQNLMSEQQVDFSAMDGMASEYQLEVLARLDPDSKDTIQHQLDDILQNDEINKIKLSVDTEATQESIQDVLEAFANDEEVGATQLSDIFSEDIVDAFKDASGGSAAFSDALTLLSDSSFNTQNSMLQLKSTLDDISHGLDFSDIIDQAEELPDSFQGASEEILNLADTLEDDAFNLSIDIGGDLIDQADGIVEALGDVQDGTELIGEGFLVAADDVESLADAFPGILDNYSVTADGMIQLDEAVAESAMAAATSDAESSAAAQAAKLRSYADYAMAMSTAYQEQANIFAQMAQSNVITNATANEAIANADGQLRTANEQGLQAQDLASKTAAENETLYSQSAGQSQADSAAQGAASAAQSFSELSVASADIANRMIAQWNAVGAAVAAAGKGQSSSANAPGGLQRNVSSTGKSVQKTAVATGTEITIGDNTFTVGRGEGAGIAASAALEYQSKAQAFANAANQALAAAAKVEASGMATQKGLGSAGRGSGKGGSGGGGGGGGGGDGGGQSYEPKQQEVIEEEVDLYEKINTQLEDVEAVISNIEKETERLYGDKARANMSKQIALLDKEIKLQKEKLEIQQKERDDLADKLRGYGAYFDSEGFFANYPTVLKSLEGRVNDLINQYNNATTEEGQEKLNEEIEAAKEALEDFKDVYKRYDELQGQEIQDTINQLEELEDSIEDVRIEAYNASQEAIDNIKDLRDDWAELQGLFTNYKSDSPFRATIEDAAKLKNIFGGTKEEAISYYQTLINERQKAFDATSDPYEKAAIYSTINFYKKQQQNAAANPAGIGNAALDLARQDLERLSNWYNNPTAADNPFGENTNALQEAYKDAYERMSDLAKESEEAWEQLEEDIIDGYDDIAEREEEQIDRYERLNDKLDQMSSLISIQKGEDAYAELARIAQKQAEVLMEQGRMQNQILQQWEERYASIADKTSDIAKAVREHMDEAEDKLIEIQESAAEAFQEHFENALSEITAQTNRQLFGSSTTDDISSNWERDKDYASRYYDDMERAVAIEQLRNKYLNLLDDAQNSSLNTQNKIRQSMADQVSYLEDQKTLSEFNVKYANAQLEILQKQIALENARQNKNQMRLRRDSQGNYRYVYSADQSDIREKEDDLLSTEFDAYQMSNENRMSTLSDALSYYQNYLTQREELVKRAATGDAAAQQALEELTADFKRDMAAYSEELSDSWEGMIGALTWVAETGNETVAATAEKMLEAIEDKTDKSLTNVGIQWNETLNSVISDINNLTQVAKDTTDEMITLANSYKETIANPNEGVASLVKNGFDNINSAMINVDDSTKALTASTKDLMQALAGDNAALAKAQQELVKYREELENVKSASSVTANRLRETQEALDRSEAMVLNYQTGGKGVGSFVDEDDSILYKLYLPGNGEIAYAKSKAEYEYRINEGIWKDAGVNKLNLEGATVPVYRLFKATENPSHKYVTTEAERDALVAQGWEYEFGKPLFYTQPGKSAADITMFGSSLLKGAMGYSTGGYTGDWGNTNGKVAILHEKELVLNQEDTNNILSAVDVTRQIAMMLQSSVMTPQNLASLVGTKIGGDTIEQRVEITAEFPNVQSASEIEAALLELSNSAYQYSHKTI